MLCDARCHTNSILETATSNAFKIGINGIPSFADGFAGVFIFECSHFLFPSGN